ncbi:MAG: Transport system permease protein [Thermotoga sp. 50_1627]|uniref:FecCD family ABC transporter permease n=1 Tax=Pseudothermotoga sp. TaxID=2033661 RepID=UPI00076C013F|nr:MAG: Transport system permease protein [Thermotoga sp. 50_64]KUK25994.1 MAG: Transport system permease protein [Thermotoga sp. 50_1627]MBC7116319.1 iron ABC transporter permease [Pseudothermotoga sp.]MDK2922683.1 cobalamin transport system permease protein [Pseudothermotoga sp.]HBT38657.1 iron ABC transporter permease [Pseudothermotoga sp.]
MKLGKWLALVAVFAVLVLLCLAVGSVEMNFADVLRALLGTTSKHRAIIWGLRLPRVLMGLIAGASLAAVGAAFQGLLRNPLVDPYLLGVSSGASFGAVLSIYLATVSGFQFLYRLPTLSFAFAMIASLVAIVLAKKDGTIPIVELVLSGVMVSVLFSSATITLLMLLRRNITHAYVWLFGSLSGVTWDDLLSPFTFFLIFFWTSLGLSQQLNAMAIGEVQAKISGVNTELVKLIIYSLGSLAAASVVSKTGVIGFVGLITPHMARKLFGSDHKVLLISSALMGAVLLCVCDAIARVIVSPSEMPIGVVTAFVGVPVMLVLLKKGESHG